MQYHLLLNAAALSLHHKVKQKTNKYNRNMEKDNKTEVKEPILPIIKTLEVGESHSYPCTRMNVVKSVISQVQVTTGKVFSTRLNKPLIRVTRLK